MTELERIATALERIAEQLSLLLPLPSIPSPPERPLGKEAISYVDEDQLIELEEEEQRLISQGRIPTVNNED